MKPMRLLVIVALLGVGALVWFLMSESRDERQGERRGASRAERSEREERGAESGDDADEANRSVGTGALNATIRILMPDGSAAGGATLTLSGRGETEASADADGAFEFRGLHRGLYNLIARSGDAVGALDFELEKTTDLGTLQLVAAVAIRGTVYDAQGLPLPGAGVEATRAAEGKSFNMTSMVKILMSPEEVVARGESDENGRYELLVPKAGYYALRARAQGFSQEAEAPRPFTASVEGVDFYLLPGVGVSGRVTDPDGAPVPGAVVMLVDPESAFGKQLPKIETTTGANGTFELAALHTDQLLLVVRSPGYATYMDSDLSLPALDMQIQLEEGISVQLKTVDIEQPGVPAPGVSVAVMYRGGFAAGETDPNGRLLLENLPVKGSRMWGGQQMAIFWGGEYVAHMHMLTSTEPTDGVLDLGKIPLTRGGVVTGKVTDKTTGDPVAGARLRALGGLDRQLDMMGAVNTLSAEDGTYTLRGVPPKANMILAVHPEYVADFDPMKTMMMFQGRSGDGDGIFAPGKRKAERDIELTPAATIEGRVLGPDGNPVPSAKVEVRDELAMIRVMLGAGSISAVADADGRFVLKGMKLGQELNIFATHRDFGNSEVVQAKAGEPIDLRLEEPLQIVGLCVDEAGEPVAGVRVSVARAEQAAQPGAMTFGGGAATTRPAISDADGKFAVRNAPPGRLSVSYEHSGYEPVTTSIDVAPGTDEHDLGKTTMKRGLGIEGVVVDESDKPVGGVHLSVSWDYSSGQPQADESGRMHGQARTDAQGKFQLYGLRTGKYSIRAWQPGFFADSPLVEAGSKEVRIVLEKAAELVGRVTAAGQPVARANVSARIIEADGKSTRNVGWARTDPQGRFVIESLPRDTTFSLTIRHDGYRTTTIDGVTAGAEERDYALEPGIRIGGVVVEADGTPVPNANLAVQVHKEDGSTSHKNVRTDEQGLFEAGGLDAGEIVLQLARWNTDYLPTEEITATPGDLSIRIVVTRGESISGTLLDREGKPLKQVSIMALDADGKQIAQTWAWSDDGTFRIGGLPKGSYTLRVMRWTDGAMENLAEVADVATGTDDLEIREGS